MRTKHYTIAKNIILNWLYSTDRNVSIEKLGAWLEENTEGRYKIIDTGIVSNDNDNIIIS